MTLPDNEHIQRLDKVTNWLLVAIVFIPFVISAGALTDMARQHKMSFPWLYPFMVDGGLIIFKALALRSSLRGRRDWYTWTMAGALTVISVILNVLHVPDEVGNQALAGLMAALPPLVILAAFIAVTRRVEDSARLQTAVYTYEAIVQETAVKRSELTKLNRAIERQSVAKSNGRKSGKRNGRVTNKETALDKLLLHVDEYPNASLAEIGGVIGRSKSTVSSYISELLSTERLSKNGSGWEVEQVQHVSQAAHIIQN